MFLSEGEAISNTDAAESLGAWFGLKGQRGKDNAFSDPLREARREYWARITEDASASLKKTAIGEAVHRHNEAGREAVPGKVAHARDTQVRYRLRHVRTRKASANPKS